MNMVSVVMTETRDKLWKAMVTANFNVAYYQRIGDKYDRWDTLSKFFVAFTSSTTVGSWMLLDNTQWAMKVFSLITCVGTIIIPLIKLPDSSKYVTKNLERINNICVDYNRLWEDHSDMPEDKLSKEYKKIRDRVEQLDKNSDIKYNIKLPIKEKLEIKQQVFRDLGIIPEG
ncbi:MAG: hypothetical protein V1934_09120 [Methanobacteriota archaeon]